MADFSGERPRLHAAVARVRRIAASDSSAVTITTIGANALRIFSTVILTRLLAPEAFGQTAIIGSVFFIIGMLTDVGFQAYVVRHARGNEPDFLDAVWTLHAVRGIINFVIVLILAAPITRWLGKPDIAPLLAAMALTLLIDGFMSIRVLAAVRNGFIARLSVFELAISAIQIMLGICIALPIRSAWAIVIAAVATSVIRLAASYVTFGRGVHRPRWDAEIARDMWLFSRAIASSSIITMVIGQLDKVILARLLTLGQFGIYGIAANLASAPQALAYSYANRVLYSRYAQVERDGAGRAAVEYRSRPPFFYMYLALVGGLITLAPAIVRILYDSRYQSAARYISILAIASAMLMMTQSAINFFVAAGRPGHVLRVNVARLAWLVAVTPIAYLALGPIGLVATLGLIELPAYFLALYLTRQLDAISVRAECLSWAAIATGLAVGALVNSLLGKAMDSLA